VFGGGPGNAQRVGVLVGRVRVDGEPEPLGELLRDGPDALAVPLDAEARDDFHGREASVGEPPRVLDEFVRGLRDGERRVRVQFTDWSAEEAVHGLADGLASDVPHRLVEDAERLVGARALHRRVEVVPVRPDVPGVLADEPLAEGLDAGDERLAVGGRVRVVEGLAEPHDSLVGLQPNEDGGDVDRELPGLRL